MGFNLGAFLKIAELVAGPALAAAGVPPALIPIVMHGITIAESAANPDGSPKSGAEKKAIALDAVETGIAGINAVKPGAVDPEVVHLVSGGIDTTVGVINVIKSNGHAVNK
jgi:hypothetical protein